MQATAAMETVFGKYYPNDGGNLQKEKPSNPSSCNEVKLPLPDDEYDSLALQQRADNKEISNIGEEGLLEPSFSENQGTNEENTPSLSCEFEDSIEYDFLNETYSIHYSESKLRNENLAHLQSELHPEVQNRQETFFDILELQGSNTFGFERTHKISDANYDETAEDTAKSDVDEDSQQEYHSAEQEYISSHLSFDQNKALRTSNLHVAGWRNSGSEEKWVSSLDDRVHMETGSVTSLDSLNEFTFAQEHSPPVSKFQNSAMLKEYHEPKQEQCKEQETSLMYHVMFDDIVQRSSSLLNTQKPVKTKICTETMKSRAIANKDFCGNRIVGNSILKHLENPSISMHDKASETLPQVSKYCQTSETSIFDDSVISACGYSEYESLQSTPEPRTAAIEKQEAIEDSGLQVVNSSSTNQTCSGDFKETHPKSVADAASCTITVCQTLDVNTDFRACFTASRASAKSSLVSTSSNTEITMMDKNWPGGWPSERQKCVAYNTDRADYQDCVDAQMAVPKGSGPFLSIDSLKPNGNSLNKDSLEVRKMLDTTDLKKHPERKFQFSEEMEKKLAPECCQETMHRAIKAEMHLLNVYYETCHRHCYHIYKLVMGNKAELNRDLPSNFSRKDLGSALLSVLGDLKVKYMNLKEKIHKGIPLEELPPLSVESKILSAFSAFASRMMKEDSYLFSGADAELKKPSVPGVDVCPSLKETLSQMSLLPDSSHLRQDEPPKDDIDIDFSQLNLEGKECRSRQEMSEDWFDATENLTGINTSGRKENQTEHTTWNLKFPLEKKHVELLRGDKGLLIHVGGLCSSVSEVDLKSHFQKYQVSEVSIYGSSTNYRYASLAFTKNSDAKRAAREMNGTEINGKTVNVRLVKTPGEHTSTRVELNHSEKSSKEASPAALVSRWAETRPRQPESEHSSECSCLDQKGIKKNCKQIESPHLLPETSVLPPNTLNPRSFTKIMKRLTELHPEVSRDHIIDALQEVRTNHKGFLNGLSIGAIVEMASSFLRSSASCQEQVKQ